MESNVSRSEVPGKEPVAAPKRRHFIRFLAVVLACLVGVGFYRGWFALSARQEAETHKVDVNLSVDTDKMKEDARKAGTKTGEEAADLSAKVKQEAKRLREQSADPRRSGS
jgi:hypothetical protein